MSGIVKVNKSNLDSTITIFDKNVKNLDNVFSNVSSSLTEIPEHSDFPDLLTKASMISRSLSNLSLDFNCVSKNIRMYLDTLNKIDAEGFDVTLEEVENIFDTSSDNDSESVINNNVNLSTTITTTTSTLLSSTVIGSNKENEVNSQNTISTVKPSGSSSVSNSYDGNSGNSVSNNISGTLSSNYDSLIGGKFNYSRMEEHLDNVSGLTIDVPEGLGSVHTYMGWQCITAKDSNQYKLRKIAGMNFDEEGFAKIGDRYVVATTTTFGNVGDFIDVYQEDGTVLKCIIGDIKNQNDAGCTKWGHNNGNCVIEFVVNKDTWYSGGAGAHSNPGTVSCHPEWNQNIEKIVNKGNYFELIQTDIAKFDSSVKFSTLNEVTENIINIAENEIDVPNFDTNSYNDDNYSSDFVSWCATKAGYIDVGVIPKYSTASDGVEWFRENAIFETVNYKPKVGDIVFYDNNGDGTADYSSIVISSIGDKFTTIEGNVSESIRKSNYTIDNPKIVGYGVPDYSMLLLANEDDKETN